MESSGACWCSGLAAACLCSGLAMARWFDLGLSGPRSGPKGYFVASIGRPGAGHRRSSTLACAARTEAALEDTLALGRAGWRKLGRWWLLSLVT
jgi:hypothetical protein